MRVKRSVLIAALFSTAAFGAEAAPFPPPPPAAVPGPAPDIIVAADGSGKFKTVQEALSSIPRNNTERITVLVKKGVYKERINCPASFVTLLGESRKETRIESASTVATLGGSDFILQNITLLNTGGDPQPHAVTVSSSTADRVVFLDADVLSTGADTVSLWKNDGRYYHARCNFRGSVDSVCPHGWCYIVDSAFVETHAGSAVIWHDGHTNKDQRFVLRNCRFDCEPASFPLARHHHDALFFLLDCTFSSKLADRPIYRVLYPTNGGPPSAADIQNNLDHDPSNIWGERNYFFNCHREAAAPAAADGKKPTADFAWFKDNLTAYAPDLTADKITAKWTFAGSPNPWDPENKSGPKIQSIAPKDKQIAVTFSESVTVKGQPTLTLADNAIATYAAGSGTNTLLFNAPSAAPAKSLDLAGGFVFASQACAVRRDVDVQLP